MFQEMQGEIIRLTVSPVRRWFGLAMLGGLAVLLLGLSFSATPIAASWRFLLFALAATTAWGGYRMWEATAQALILTNKGLFTSEGETLAPLEQVVSVDRTAFAFKPTNGFLVRLRDPAPRGWAPGVWWRLGRSLGVGGVTSAGDAKVVADLLKALVAERDAAAD